jgi:hypothetical protein
VEPVPFEDFFRFAANNGGGWRPSLNPMRETGIYDGANVLFEGDEMEPVSYRGTPASGQSGGQLSMAIVGSKWGSVAFGSIFLWKNKSLIYAGSGTVIYDGATVGTASSRIRVRLASAGGAIGAGNTYDLGIAAPLVAPALVGVAGGFKMNGSYGLVYTDARSETGEESNPSPLATTSLTQGQRLQVTLPPVAAGSGCNQSFLYGTPKGLGTVGLLKGLSRYNPITRTNPAAPHVVVVEWYDVELVGLVPTTNNPPPDCTHATALESVIVPLGTFQRVGISPSDVNKPGSYPAINTIFPNPVEEILGVWTRATDGWGLFCTEHSLQGLYLTGGRQPVGVRTVWGEVGVPGGTKSGCFAEGRFYCYTSSGPARVMGEGEPDDKFSLPVQRLLRSVFNPRTTVTGWDPRNESVVYMGSLGGLWIAVAYYYKTPDTWSLPVFLPGQPQACVTYADQLYIVINGTLRAWNTGGSLVNVPGRAEYHYMRTGMKGHGMRRTFREGRAAASGGMGVRLYTNLDFVTPVEEFAANQGWLDLYAPQANTYAVEAYGNLGGETLYEIELAGYTDPRKFG